MRAKTENGRPTPAYWAFTSWVRRTSIQTITSLSISLNPLPVTEWLTWVVCLFFCCVVPQVCGWRVQTVQTSTPSVAPTMREWWRWPMTSVKSTSSSTPAQNPKSGIIQCHIFQLISIIFTPSTRKLTTYQMSYFTHQAPNHIYEGHGSHVTNVRFTHCDSHVLSMGGKDTCILQWEVKRAGTGDGGDRLHSASFTSSPEP